MNKDKQKSSIAAALSEGRKGASTALMAPKPASDAAGLILAPVDYKPLAWFRPNPENEIFRALKSEAYWRDLERDVREAGRIVTPALALPDGLLLEGESRLEMSRRLGFPTMPVQIILSPMSLEEQRKRLWLGNLSRFEVDEDTRLLLYAKIWPGYFRGDTVSPSSPTRAEIAEATGKSERQVKRDAGIMREATARASSEGREASVVDIAAAREAKNAARREKPSAAPENPAIVRVRRALEGLEEEAAVYNDDDTPRALAIRDGILMAVKKIEEALR